MFKAHVVVLGDGQWSVDVGSAFAFCTAEDLELLVCGLSDVGSFLLSNALGLWYVYMGGSRLTDCIASVLQDQFWLLCSQFWISLFVGCAFPDFAFV